MSRLILTWLPSWGCCKGRARQIPEVKFSCTQLQIQWAWLFLRQNKKLKTHLLIFESKVSQTGSNKLKDYVLIIPLSPVLHPTHTILTFSAKRGWRLKIKNRFQKTLRCMPKWLPHNGLLAKQKHYRSIGCEIFIFS